MLCRGNLGKRVATVRRQLKSNKKINLGQVLVPKQRARNRPKKRMRDNACALDDLVTKRTPQPDQLYLTSQKWVSPESQSDNLGFLNSQESLGSAWLSGDEGEPTPPAATAATAATSASSASSSRIGNSPPHVTAALQVPTTTPAAAAATTGMSVSFALKRIQADVLRAQDALAYIGRVCKAKHVVLPWRTHLVRQLNRAVAVANHLAKSVEESPLD